MAIGPVEYMIVAFPGNQFRGEIVPALKELQDAGTVRIIDLAFVMKEADGTVTALEASDLESEVGSAFQTLLGEERGGLFNEEDLDAAAEELEPNSSAALLVWEDVWAAKVVKAIRDADGILLDLERIPQEVVEAAVEYAEGVSS
jgi:uncharacterized membrane protein